MEICFTSFGLSSLFTYFAHFFEKSIFNFASDTLFTWVIELNNLKNNEWNGHAEKKENRTRIDDHLCDGASILSNALRKWNQREKNSLRLKLQRKSIANRKEKLQINFREMFSWIRHLSTEGVKRLSPVHL
jgi:hypothetical protein